MDATACIDSCLLDVADLSMDALDKLYKKLADTVLGSMLLRRLEDEAVHPVGVPYSAFDSSI